MRTGFDFGLDSPRWYVTKGMKNPIEIDTPFDAQLVEDRLRSAHLFLHGIVGEHPEIIPVSSQKVIRNCLANAVYKLNQVRQCACLPQVRRKVPRSRIGCVLLAKHLLDHEVTPFAQRAGVRLESY